jgi:hypothetical protein
MAELLLVSNPKRRRKRAKSRRRRKLTAKQLAAGFGGKKHRRRRSRRRHAVAAAPRRRRRRSHARRSRARPSGARPAVGYVVGSRRIRRRKLNPHRRHYRRRHNPSLRGIVGGFVPLLKAGGWGAAGALGLDALWGLVYPRLGSFGTYLANPYIGFAAKGFGALLVGRFGGKVFRGRGQQLAVGAMTVITHDFLKTTLQGMAPTIFGAGGAVPLGNLGVYLGAYLSGSAPMVGTATMPQSYLPFNGPTGTDGGSGVYVEDVNGQDPWASANSDYS